MGVCYRPPEQEDQADEVPHRQVGAATCSQALVLLGKFSHAAVCWRDDTGRCKHVRRFVECFDDKTACSQQQGRLKAALAAVTMEWWSSRS